MDSLDLLVDFAASLSSPSVVFSPPDVRSDNGHTFTKDGVSHLVRSDVITGNTVKQRPHKITTATAPRVEQENIQHPEIQGALSAQHPPLYEQSRYGQGLPADYISHWFGGRQSEFYANAQAGTAREYPEYFDYMSVPTWTVAYASEGLPPYPRNAWVPYQRAHDINMALPVAEIYREPCRDATCNCQGLGPPLAQDLSAYMPVPVEERHDARVVFDPEQVQITEEEWVAVQEEQYRMSQAQQF
jgi:hypothetical protein